MLLRFALPIVFGILPTFIWLIFYLNKDLHPEPKRMIAKIFFLGMFLSIGIAVATELGITFLIGLITGLSGASSYPVYLFIIYNFLAIALVEELSKYLIVKLFVFKNPAFDEPVDTMIYMITAALGFAALENILVLSSINTASYGSDIVAISFLRFLGATFLHALASATIGYFVALSFYNARRKKAYVFSGFFLATLLHGIYNMSLIKSQEISAALYNITSLEIFSYPLYIPTFLLIFFAIFVSLFFKKLTTIFNTCKYEITKSEDKF